MFATLRSTVCKRRPSKTRPSQVNVQARWLAILLALLCLPAIGGTTEGPAASAPAPESARICAACHGADGAGNASGVARIGGMDATYLAHTLAAFKQGTRHSEAMQPIAGNLSDADIVALAQYFSIQHPSLAPSPQPPVPSRVAAGKSMALQGDGKGIPACFSCHAAGGRGNGERYPAIAGQTANYVVNRLREFQARARLGSPKPGSMTEVASKLTDTQIHDLAAYLSVLPAP